MLPSSYEGGRQKQIQLSSAKRKTRRVRKQGTAFHETGIPHQCQCSIACALPATRGSPYCRQHRTMCPSISPLTGAEPDFDPALWNKRRDFRETHNCFSYAMNVFDPKQVAKCKGKYECNAPFHQPGASAGYPPFTEDAPKTCPNMLARIFGDNPFTRITDFESKCPAGASKIALILDQSDDYHFLRQDSNGYWSHKPGARPVTNVDAVGHLIRNPRLANYNYTANGDSTLNYDIFCSYMCVPRNRPLYLRISGGGRADALLKHFL